MSGIDADRCVVPYPYGCRSYSVGLALVGAVDLCQTTRDREERVGARRRRGRIGRVAALPGEFGSEIGLGLLGLADTRTFDGEILRLVVQLGIHCP